MEWAIGWNAVSAAANVATAIIALFAFLGWNKQAKLKAKLDFKNAVSAYAYCMMAFPAQLNTPVLRSNFQAKSQELKDLIAKAGWAWFVAEELLNSEKVIVKAWHELNDLHGSFLKGEASNDAIIEQCSIIIVRLRIF